MKNVGKDWSIVIGGEHEPSGADDVAVERHTGALEVLRVVVPVLRDTSFRFYAGGWFLGVDPGDVALSLLPASAAATALVGRGRADEQNKAES